VTYIESGLFDVQLGGKKRRMGAGDCYFVPPDVDHGVVAWKPASVDVHPRPRIFPAVVACGLCESPVVIITQ
jgi:glyoxylate utilization-related uncharacterized protein